MLFKVVKTKKHKCGEGGHLKRVIPVHATVPGRLRLRIDGLYRSEQMRAGLESLLPSLPGVRRASANSLTGTVLIVFSAETEAPRVIAAVERMLRKMDVEGFHANGNGADAHTLSAQKQQPCALVVKGMPEAWHSIPPETAIEKCNTSVTGLSPTVAAERLRRCGRNVLVHTKARPDMHIFLGQFQNLPTVLLGSSALLSIFTGGVADALVIGAVMMANALFGFYTERQVERTIHALERGPLPRAKVVRGGRRIEFAASEVVPGDLLLISRGDMVPADARLITAEHLTVDESMLTGESENVAKSAAPTLDRNMSIGDRCNMIYRGTLITGGEGTAVVVATGAATEIGKIEQLISESRPPETPMQRQLREIGSRLIGVSGMACAGVFVIGLLRGYSVLEMVRTSISLAIAAIPEGLPAVATTTLARGVRQLDAQGVLVRRLDAIETLASVQTICLDKTGTLTCNQQTVTTLFAGNTEHLVGDGTVASLRDPDVVRLLEVAVLCNEVRVSNGGGKREALDGSSTEQALVRTALDAGMDVTGLRERFPMQQIRQRSERRNRMVSLHRVPDGRFLVAVKGRPNEVLARCCSMLKNGAIVPLTKEAHDVISAENHRMAGDALRVLGFAFREVNNAEDGDDRDLVWVGLMGMHDPLRHGAETLISQFHRAGMRTVMITGDQSATAQAIGRRLNLSRGAELETIDSVQLEELAPEVLQQIAHDVHVFSRVSPSHKLQIIRTLQAGGGVVAMTGDGINDGPALKAADIGIAVGAKEVARNVADMVLLDDDLGKILNAVAQSRTISDDIRKAISYLISTNMTEIYLSFISLLLGFGQPLTPMQLLWINLVSDIFPELALACEPPEGDVLDHSPTRIGAPLIESEEFVRLGLDASVITAGALASFGYGLARYGRSPKATSLAFFSLVTGQLTHTWSARSRQHSIFGKLFHEAKQAELAANPAIQLAVGTGFALEAAAAFVPVVRRVLGTSPLGPLDWLVSALGGVAPFLINEIRKAVGSGTLQATGEIGHEVREPIHQLAGEARKIRDDGIRVQ